MKLKVIAVIPARYNASRFPGKLLQDLNGESIISKTYKSALATGLFDDIIVAADDKRIIKEIEKHNGKAVMTSSNHPSGSDRIAEVIAKIDTDLVVNVQGDEPFLVKEDLAKLINVFENDVEKEIHVGTLAEKLSNLDDAKDPNNVKVVLDNKNNALYFSRALVPFDRDHIRKVNYYKHIGIYAFRKNALIEFTKLAQGNLERIEKLEQLRYLENGYTIRVAMASGHTIGIDTQEDLEKAREFIKQMEQ